MNDLIITIIIVTAIIIYSVFYYKISKFDSEKSPICFIVGIILLGIVYFGSVSLAIKEYETIPYSEIPESEYQLAETNHFPIYQTGESGSISFFALDGTMVSINHVDEVSVIYSDTAHPIVRMYERDDGGAKWFLHHGRRKQKVIITLPKEYETVRFPGHANVMTGISRRCI